MTSPISRTRGFLFADLRGYSAYTERHGDRAAEGLIGRYRELVRTQIAKFHGAEVRTEGDSFYVVFDSVSQAVRAGLAIRDAAARASEHDHDPIHVGIGLHAGEVEDGEHGIVSSAVNIAARVCAVARPGEVLATDTVRSLTRTALPVSYVAAGRRRLKGISEPVPVFRVESSIAAGRPTGITGRRGVLAIVGLVVVAAAAVGFVALRAAIPTPDDDRTANAPSIRQTVVSASPTPTGTAAFLDAEVLDEDQRANLEYIAPGRREQCGPARLEDGPKFRDVGGLPWGAPAPIASMATSGGIHCLFSRSTSGPTSVWIWRISQTTNPSAPINAREWMASHSAQVGASEGVCTSDEAANLETWTFSGRSGQLLCFLSVTGDAIVYWTYDGANVVGKAIRDDRDMALLLEWWRAEARLAGR